MTDRQLPSMLDIQCPICNTLEDSKNISTHFFKVENEEHYFHLCYCQKCEIGFLNPQPQEDILKLFYPDYFWRDTSGASFWIENKIVEKLFTSEIALIKKYSSCSAQPASMKILDVGCGSGDFLSLLNKTGWQAHGIDTSVEVLAKIAAGPDSTITIASIMDEDLPFQEESFDVVILLHTLEHVNDPCKAISNVYKLLKPGGIVIVQVPNYGSFLSQIFKSKWIGLQIPRHLFHFTPRSLLLLHKQMHLQCKKVAYYSIRSSPAQVASTFFPSLEPAHIRQTTKSNIKSFCLKGLYLLFLILLLPISLVEAIFHRGNTITIVAEK